MKTIQRNAICILLLLVGICFGKEVNTPLANPGNKKFISPNPGPLPYGLAISDFTLVDAQTNKDVYVLKEGGIINKATIASSRLNIRANEIDAQSGIQVDFDLQGPLSHQRVERQAPYALFGDTGGIYSGKVFPIGTYFLRASAYSVDNEGNKVLINEITLGFIVGQETNEITGLNLIDAEFDTDLDLPSREYHLKDGRVFDNDNYPFYINGPREINIKATTNSYSTGSVAFILKGPITFSKTENSEPFTLFGDLVPDYFGRVFPPGNYMLTVTTYSEKNKKGIKGPSLIVSFTLADLPEIAIQEFAGFIQADTDLESVYLSPYLPNVINQEEIPTDFVNLAVYPSFPENGLASVFLELKGPVTISRTENTVPYALFGDTNSDYNGRMLPPGQYLLKATPYTGPNRTGLAGQGYSYDLEIRGPVFAMDSGKEENKLPLLVWPNPARANSEVWIGNGSDDLDATLYNFSGALIKRFAVPEKETVPLDVSALKKGLYILKFSQGSESVSTKILVVE